LGAGLYGAGLSRQFKTKDIKVNDLIAHDVQATYFAATTSTNVRPRSITTSIFPAGSKTGTKKTLTFKRKEDFSIFLDYKKSPAPYVLSLFGHALYLPALVFPEDSPHI